jgi:AraC-like DNA-binding protein/ligand-binding sensor protein
MVSAMWARPAITFADLADSREFTRFFSMMWHLAGIVVGIVEPSGSDSRKLFSAEMESPLCRLVGSSPQGFAACREDALSHGREAVASGAPGCYVCHAGLMDFTVPIVVEGCHLATIEGGQVLVAPPSEAGFAGVLDRTRSYGLDESALREAYFRTPHVPSRKLAAAVELVRLFAQQCSESWWRLRRGRAEPPRPEIEAARAYVAAHFQEGLSMPGVARAVHLSPSHFSVLFSRETGSTFTEYVQRTRIEQAKRRLIETAATITEIAFAVGFNSLTHFNYVFKRLEGSAPSVYRASRTRNE